MNLMAFQCDDLAATVEMMKSNGVRVIETDPTHIMVHPKSTHGILMQLVEMATDIALHGHYPGFNTAYLAHHMSTLLATAACLWWTYIPVGGVVAIITLMEMGGLALNCVSIWKALVGSSKVPPLLYDFRLLAFCGSRLMATGVLLKTCAIALTMDQPPWAAIIFAWCLCAARPEGRWLGDG